MLTSPYAGSLHGILKRRRMASKIPLQMPAYYVAVNSRMMLSPSAQGMSVCEWLRFFTEKYEITSLGSKDQNHALQVQRMFN